jgi:hypothetical protein
MTTAAPPIAFRHRCISLAGTFCTRGNGKPRAARCTYCKGQLLTESGTWGVFVWRGDARYPLADALSTHKSEAAAERAARTDTSLVWRFVA